MRPEMKSTRNESLIHDKRNSIYINAHCGQNEVTFRFEGGSRKTAYSLKANHFCFDEIIACADVSFHMTSFRVVFT